MNLKYISIIFILVVIVGGGIFWFSSNIEDSFNLSSEGLDSIGHEEEADMTDNQQLRDRLARFVRETAESYFNSQETEDPEELAITGDWNIFATIYYQGEIRGVGQKEGNLLNSALKEAVISSLTDEKYGEISQDELGDSRFLIRVMSLPNQLSFIEYQGQGIEVINNLVPTRELDKNLIYQKIEQGKEFLFKMSDEAEHGFHKYYYALDDRFENRLHTVYSASIIYTFLYLYDLEKEEEILENLSDWTGFILLMQNLNKGDESYGAFHYSLYLYCFIW